MKSNFKNLLILLVAVVFIASCGGGGKKEAPNASDEFDSAKKKVAAEVKKVISDLPPPSEVPYLLISAGADFDASLVNPLDKISSYESDGSTAALNLGIYAVDIAYLSTYERSEKALEYMNKCQKLTAFVGVGDAIDYGMVAKFENNMENKDSLIVVVNEIIRKASESLTELDQINSAATMLAGIWFEGMYISTMIVDNYSTDGMNEDQINLVLEPLVQVVLKQKGSLNHLIKSLNDVATGETGTDSITKTIEDLNKVKAIYDGELAEVEKKITENTGDYKLSRDVLNNMTAQVKSIRANIVK